MDYLADWTLEGLSLARTRALSRCPPYREIIRLVAEQADPAKIKFVIDKGYLAPIDDALRPLFYLEVGDELADWFFNGVAGYRAQYYHSVANGVAANRHALDQLETRLLEAARTAGWRSLDCDNQGAQFTMPEALVLTSLRSPSAKVWGDETEGEFSQITKGQCDETPQIIARRWVENSRANSWKAKANAIKGVKAPRLTILKFQGAFLKEGEEKLPSCKQNRSEDIYRYGWS